MSVRGATLLQPPHLGPPLGIAALTPRAVVSPENAWSWHEVQQVVDGLLRYHFDNQDCSLDGPLW